MPLLCFDLVEGRSERQLKKILDVTHEVLVGSFNVPHRDRYQIVREHPPSRMIIEDTGLGIKRTPNMLVLQVTTRPRSRAMKQVFYSSLVERLADQCGISPSDVCRNELDADLLSIADLPSTTVEPVSPNFTEVSVVLCEANEDCGSATLSGKLSS